ncbi:MAG: peptide/nickel transport system substrate-binding protein, partial [Acetobacteraceae bacterium]|nr:peptide/nickel transport system substrate-binding protein [Acetobacteraceae bacterium]
ARKSTDLATRVGYYGKLMEQERKDLPIIYLYNPVNIVGLSVKISGFRPVPDGIIRLQGLSVSK